LGCLIWSGAIRASSSSTESSTASASLPVALRMVAQMELAAQASRAVLPSVQQPAPHAPSGKPRRGCPELHCVAQLVGADALSLAELRAERLGTGADRALIAMGALDEETYVRALAADLGVAFADLDDLPRAACPLADAGLIEAAAAGMATLTTGDGSVWLAALRGQRLWRVPLHHDGTVGTPQSLLQGRFGRLRSVEVEPDGSLLLLTSNTFRGEPRAGDDRLVRVVLSR